VVSGPTKTRLLIGIRSDLVEQIDKPHVGARSEPVSELEDMTNNQRVANNERDRGLRAEHGRHCIYRDATTLLRRSYPVAMTYTSGNTARLLALVIVLTVGLPSHEGQAQRLRQGSEIYLDPVPTQRAKKRVRRPPLMPPTPKDFGPHFDFPAGGSYNFNCGQGYSPYCGAPSHAPYPE
jgi:hypothetical protein